MKVAVFHNLPSGGAKRALHGMLRELAASGHSLRVYVPDTADESYLPLGEVTATVRSFPVRTTLRGALVSTLRYIPPLRISLADLEETQREIAEEINGSDCDAAWVEQDRFVMAPFLLRYLKKPFVYMCPQVYRSASEQALSDAVSRYSRSVLRDVWRKRVLYRGIPPIDRQNVSFAGCILANSCFTREAISRAYGRQAEVCYPGIDTAIFQPMELQRSDYVLSVGSVTPGKGYDFLIRSLALLDVSARPRLKIVANSADPSAASYLREMAAFAGIRLEIHQMVGDDELAELYNRALVFVYAPYDEPLGMAPLEALACGTAVVAVAEGGVRETITDGVTGRLTPRDERAFAEALTTLVRDESLRREMGSRGPEMVRKRWSLQVAAKRAEQFLTQVAAR